MAPPAKLAIENLTNTGKGRPKGSLNKVNATLREAILKAAEKAGGKGGTIAYLTQQAIENPGPFLALLGKVLPMVGPGDNGEHIVKIEADAAFANILADLGSIASRAASGGVVASIVDQEGQT